MLYIFDTILLCIEIGNLNKLFRILDICNLEPIYKVILNIIMIITL